MAVWAHCHVREQQTAEKADADGSTRHDNPRAVSREKAPMTAAAIGTMPDTPAPAARHRWLKSEEARGLAMISPTFLYALALLLLPVLIVVTYSKYVRLIPVLEHLLQ